MNLIFCFIFRLNFFAILLFVNIASASEAPEIDSSLIPSPTPGPSLLERPLMERYVLDELKALRTELAQAKVELYRESIDREHRAVDRAVSYTTDTITYFFYLVAAVSSVLVIAGWSSIREIKEKVHSVADQEISRLVKEYESRLLSIEKQLSRKSLSIRKNKEEIELTNQVQSLWLRAAQESVPENKIAVYDQILKIKPEDCEAITYKADAVLELDEPQWAASLCHQALSIDENNDHAFYQLGCAYTTMEKYDEAITYLSKAVSHSEAYKQEIENDSALDALRSHEGYEALMATKPQ